jgi:hypothetical protein
MAIQAIADWLNGDRDFYSGVCLYELYGTSDILKLTFSFGVNAVTTAKLEEELLQLNRELSEDDRETVEVVSNVLPDDIVSIERQAKDLFKEMAFLHASLENDQVNPTDEIRLQSALRIRELHLEIRSRYKMVDHFRETGERIVEAAAPVKSKFNLDAMSPVELVRRRLNILSYISKLKKETESNPSAQRLLKIQSRLENYNAELKAIEEKL